MELRDVQDNFVHEIRVANENTDAPHLLLLHGYGGSGPLYYKMVADLKKYYNLTMVDWLGMGCSGRPPFSTKVVDTPRLAIDYFIVSLEAWMATSGYKTRVGKDRGFSIVGHSLGGYIGAHYAVSDYCQGFVKNLLLLSPGGLPRQPEETQAQIDAKKEEKGVIDGTKETLW